jgi:PncC family amidohydrolase
VYPKILALRDALHASNERLVLAESCTAGNVAAELGQIPGISNSLCGSMVVYRNDSKTQWLGIDRHGLDDPERGPVSQWVTGQLALAALKHTPEATLAAAITGHLGPGAPTGLDGVIYCAACHRDPPGSLTVIKHQLSSPMPQSNSDFAERRARQVEATHALITFLLQWLLSRGLDPASSSTDRARAQ